MLTSCSAESSPESDFHLPLNNLTNNMKNSIKIVVLYWFILFSINACADTRDDYFKAVALNGESEVIALALRNYDLNVLNDKGEHALHVAIREGSTKVAAFLLQQRIIKFDIANPDGETPLMLAALRGQVDIARKLIERGAAVNKTGWTPLHYAASNPKPEAVDMIKLLIEFYAYIDAESPNKTTPLMMAAYYGSEEAARLLLEEGADPTLRNVLGLTAIDFARKAERDQLAKDIAESLRGQQPEQGRW